MSKTPNMLSAIEPWDLVASGYAETTMEVLAHYAVEAVSASRLKPGGTIAVTSWAPIDRSPAMQLMFGAIRAIKPDIAEPQKSIDTLKNPDVFKQEMLDAGFTEVKIQSVTKAAFPVTSIPEFWDDMVKGSAPIQMLKKGMGDGAWREKEVLAIRYLEEKLPKLPTRLSSDAWLGVGVK